MYLKNYRSKMTSDQKAKRMERQKAYRSRKKPIELAISEFHDIASEGPVYICFCCNQLWYKQSVLNAKKLKDLNPVIHEYLEEKRRTDTCIIFLCMKKSSPKIIAKEAVLFLSKYDIPFFIVRSNAK